MLNRNSAVACFVTIVLAIINPNGSQALGSSDMISSMCERAAQKAAREVKVPVDVLRAITLTETGRATGTGLQAWPWAINIEGQGYWLSSAEETKQAIENNLKSGVQNFDVGCFQINYRWHGQNFSSIEQMLNPTINARYAARFLKNLHKEMGSWNAAVGAYHSRNPEVAARYLARYQPILSAQSSTPKSKPDLPNNFPLLRGGSNSSSLGSLFPRSTAPSRRLIGSHGGRG